MLSLLLSSSPLARSLSQSSSVFLPAKFTFCRYSSYNNFYSSSQSLQVSCLSRMSASPAKTSPSKRSSSTSPIKSSPVKKVKLDENMPVVEFKSAENVEVLKELGNNNTNKGQVQVECTPKIMFAKMSENAQIPTRGSKLAAGYDLKSAYKYTVPARGSCLVKTDIQVKLPSGTYGRVAPRSGLALKNKIDVGGGVIDEDYRGNIGVILFNHGETDFEVNEGDRVAQLICQKIYYPEAVEVKNLDETERGEGGFGSTGVGDVKA